MKTEILSGFHPVIEALKAGRRRFLEIRITRETPPKRLEKVQDLARRFKVPVTLVSSIHLDEWTRSSGHQGIGAEVGGYPLADLNAIFTASGTKKSLPFLLFLDTVVDPHNLGALIRTAVGAGVDGIVTAKDRAAPPTPTVSRVSAGALEHALLARVTNLVAAIQAVKRRGLWVVGMDGEAEEQLFNMDFKGPVALVIGAEGKGIRPLVKRQCDFLTAIPQQGPVRSLNASVAGAVVMYEVFRQRCFL